MNETFESMEQGLAEAIAHARGEIRTTVHEIKVPDADVLSIRESSGQSQTEFASCIGVAKATLVNWEQKRSRPSGPARVLLSLIAKDPTIIQQLRAS